MSERLEQIMEQGFGTLADLIGKNTAAIAQSNERMDHRFASMEAKMDRGFETLAGLIGETNGRLDQTNQRLGRLESRFDHFLETGGRETRALREDLEKLSDRVTRLEDKAA